MKPLVYDCSKMPLLDPQVLSLPPPGFCRLDLRRCPPHPFMPTSTPGSRQLEVRRVTHVAGPSMEADQQASSIIPWGHHSGLPSLQRPWLHSLHQVQNPLPGSSRYLGAASRGQRSPRETGRTPQPALAAHSPSAVQTTTLAVPERSQPAHPSRPAPLLSLACALSPF